MKPHAHAATDVWRTLAEHYRAERATSFASLLIDPWVKRFVARLPRQTRVLDLGAGTGYLTEIVARLGHSVLAVEPNADMRAELASVAARISDVQVLSTVDDVPLDQKFDLVLCINVLDHVPSLRPFLERVVSLMGPSSLLLLSIPHPMKDLGDWVKSNSNGQWTYECYRLTDYLAEGPCDKVREDRYGNVVVPAVRSQHRTISSYLRALSEAGLHVEEVAEPQPDLSAAEEFPVLFTKCSRIPYFLTFVCTTERRRALAPSRDAIFSEAGSGLTSFVFDAQVAKVFADMVERSVPGYAAFHDLTCNLILNNLKPGGRVYDLGCSLGTQLLLLAQRPGSELIELFGVDSSPAMIAQAEERARVLLGDERRVEFEVGDIRDAKLVRADFVILSLVLQFLPIAARETLLRSIGVRMNHGGVVVVFEKVVEEDQWSNNLLIKMHEFFKEANGYSQLEIAEKRRALDGVLIPLSESENLAMFRRAGFGRACVMFRSLNFVGFVLQK